MNITDGDVILMSVDTIIILDILQTTKTGILISIASAENWIYTSKYCEISFEHECGQILKV